ncbi:MAG TPA: TIGR03088 family PEP-CTERM/XrtA system glycosyltransferase [Casimicrobiaceae bacterium]|nr:TIGR03088 family PEP-CTERM/XrtA system glycosyltransferase [Casimicrobiaceae bacterium]
MRPQPQLVAHVVYRFGVGGLENGIVNLVNHLSRDRWRHAIVSLTDISREFTERIVHPDVTYLALGKRPGHLVRDYPKLLREFKALRPAIVHTRNLAALEAAVPAWAAGVPVRIHGEHGWDIQDPAGRRRRYRLVRKLYRPFVQHYIALSRHLADYLEQQVGVPDTSLSQIYNGVDTDRFYPSIGRGVIPDCPFQGPDCWLVGSVGRLESIKDPLNLVRAFIRARAIHPVAAQRARLLIAGDGALRQQAESLLAEGGARDYAWFAGERADVPHFMRGLDCFALPSLAEGVSNTILEAMATRLPVVATRVGGNAELIESGMTGTLVPAANPDALASAVLAYFDDRATANRHAKAALRVVATRFSLTTMVVAYDRVYERTLAAAGVSLPASRGPVVQAAADSARLQRATLP